MRRYERIALIGVISLILTAQAFGQVGSTGGTLGRTDKSLSGERDDQTPHSDSKQVDLRGHWVGEFTVDPTLTIVKMEEVEIKQNGTQIRIIKITGDDYVPAGTVSVRGNYESNPFHAEQVCAGRGFVNANWQRIKISILDNDHFKIEGGCSGAKGTNFERRTQ
jgi:hypothetical protein